MRIEVVGIQSSLTTPGWLADRVACSGKDLQVGLPRNQRLGQLCPHGDRSLTLGCTQIHFAGCRRLSRLPDRAGNANCFHGRYTAQTGTMPSVSAFFHEFWHFGLNQAWACLYAGLLLAGILASRLWWPADAPLHRYDALLFYAVFIQGLLLVTRLEHLREVLVIAIFHAVATGLEIYKTAIGAWVYPEPFRLGWAQVPAFAGFMYAAVGSYLARVVRVFDFHFTAHPPRPATWVLAGLIYANFFTQHLLVDLRWLLLLAALWLYRRTWVHFRMVRAHRRMPLLLGFALVALFIWFAEQLGTLGRIWIYPDQGGGWRPVSAGKLLAWFLLMLVSFALVQLIHRPRDSAHLPVPH